MKHKEFKKAVEDWGRKYNYATEVTMGDFGVHLKVKFDGVPWFISTISDVDRFVLNTTWAGFSKIKIQARVELFDVLVELAKTPPEDRESEKRFIIPLPALTTTDGKQQYLTHKDCKFFASRRNSKLRQIWKEEHLKFVPEVYRQFAVEFDEEIEELNEHNVIYAKE